ncbi:1332_t:CDS:2 [Acaulospora morrowiae]|uniref:1332_t:CDS:1 n=1 Tax=Acaulospora morrowiae TaxID=94023 RepID=A0A9N8Z4D1_9GLOM|nr:1332_t:CDS:2 [Acaulospora morrowiae]
MFVAFVITFLCELACSQIIEELLKEDQVRIASRDVDGDNANQSINNEASKKIEK